MCICKSKVGAQSHGSLDRKKVGESSSADQRAKEGGGEHGLRSDFHSPVCEPG